MGSSKYDKFLSAHYYSVPTFMDCSLYRYRPGSLPLISGGYALFKKDYKGFGWLALSILITPICLEILKRIVPEKLPTGSSRPFPSGNTAAAFLDPAFLVVRYGHSILSLAVAFSFLAVNRSSNRPVCS
ncbi:hypothetical protein PHSC3_000448 [Chlamydiales bacterium STE3]|nr:hypothetical protein PHSC3_000448 [Chlamydiales bacterium STE3]